MLLILDVNVVSGIKAIEVEAPLPTSVTAPTWLEWASLTLLMWWLLDFLPWTGHYCGPWWIDGVQRRTHSIYRVGR